jgi:hypothetical protein
MVFVLNSFKSLVYFESGIHWYTGLKSSCCTTADTFSWHLKLGVVVIASGFTVFFGEFAHELIWSHFCVDSIWVSLTTHVPVCILECLLYGIVQT